MQYIWSVQMPEAQVSMMGLLAIQAKYLPYANLAMDLIIGGPELMLQAATGLLSAFLWDYVRRARIPPGSTLQSRSSCDAFVVKYIQPCLTTPAWLRRFMRGNARMHETSYGTAFTPASTSNASSWWPLGRQGGRATGASTSRGRSSAVPDRDAIRAATEARLRQGRTDK